MTKAWFARAQILKNNHQLKEACHQLEQILASFPGSNQKAQVLFELTHLEYQQKLWTSCRSRASLFVTEFPKHELTAFAWRYLASASAEIATGNPAQRSLKEQLAADLLALLKQQNIFSQADLKEWKFFLAKTFFELSSYRDAMSTLQVLLEDQTPFPQEANAKLLLAFCYRDGLSKMDQFCFFAEEALAKNADLIDRAQIHLFLFNAYLEQSNTKTALLEKASEHLYAAFEAKADIQPQNLLWLADTYYSQIPEDAVHPPLSLVQRSISLLERALKGPKIQLKENNLMLEPAFCKLAKLYGLMGRFEEQVHLLELVTNQYAKAPTHGWVCIKEVQLLLAEGYVHTGKEDSAHTLFEQILNSCSSLRSGVAVSASLQSARLKLAQISRKQFAEKHQDILKIVTQLKDLVIQRSLTNEPLHLEAALDYIELQTKMETLGNPTEKKLALLIKTKSDFEETGDLLSKDYHNARAKLPQKNRIYEGYIQFFDAQIFVAQAILNQNFAEQKELQAKAKDLLLRIVEEQPHPALVSRAQLLLMSIQRTDDATP